MEGRGYVQKVLPEQGFIQVLSLYGWTYRHAVTALQIAPPLHCRQDTCRLQHNIADKQHVPQRPPALISVFFYLHREHQSLPHLTRANGGRKGPNRAIAETDALYTQHRRLTVLQGTRRLRDPQTSLHMYVYIFVGAPDVSTAGRPRPSPLTLLPKGLHYTRLTGGRASE